MFLRQVRLIVTALVLLAASAASADVFDLGGTRNPDGSWTGLASLEFVPVGNPGNTGELSGASVPGGHGPDRICGAVDYNYQIGKYEVTAGQYKEFLSAVAKTDPYGLYSTRMDTANNSWGCGITRSGGGTQIDPYIYNVASDLANRPVNCVSWGNAARFANWLTNGQQAGILTGNPAQDAWLTEDGSYVLNGNSTDLLTVTRKANARYVIPTEDEWYKAAYYKGGSTNAGYWDYPTSSDTAPGRDMADVSGNNANYMVNPSDVFPIDGDKYTTVVGEFQNSESPYETFDQGGNVWEWNEAILVSYTGTLIRGMRGGSFYQYGDDLQASFRADHPDLYPANDQPHFGFRLAEVPEPATIGLLALGGLGVALRLRSGQVGRAKGRRAR